MPNHHPRATSADAEHDLDTDVDVFDEPTVNDPDAERAAEHQLARTDNREFRTPIAGERLTAEDLAQDLRDATTP